MMNVYLVCKPDNISFGLMKTNRQRLVMLILDYSRSASFDAGSIFKRSPAGAP